jgi:hypothetical protein
MLRASFLLSLFFNTEYGDDVLPKRRLIFSGLYGVTSQQTEFLEKVFVYLCLITFFRKRRVFIVYRNKYTAFQKSDIPKYLRGSWTDWLVFTVPNPVSEKLTG